MPSKLSLLCVLVFVACGVVSIVLGGMPRDCTIVAEYCLSNHGVETEVSLRVFQSMQLVEIIVIGAWVVMFISLIRDRKRAKK